MFVHIRNRDKRGCNRGTVDVVPDDWRVDREQVSIDFGHQKLLRTTNITHFDIEGNGTRECRSALDLQRLSVRCHSSDKLRFDQADEPMSDDGTASVIRSFIDQQPTRSCRRNRCVIDGIDGYGECRDASESGVVCRFDLKNCCAPEIVILIIVEIEQQLRSDEVDRDKRRIAVTEHLVAKNIFIAVV